MDSRKPLLLEHFFSALSSTRKVVSGFGLGLVASLLVVSLLVSVGAPPTITSSLFSWFSSFSAGAGPPYNTHQLNTSKTPSTASAPDLNKTQIANSTDLVSLGGLEKTQGGDLPESHSAGKLPKSSGGLIDAASALGKTQNGSSHLVSSGGLEKAHDGGLSKNHSTDSVSSAGDAAKTHNSTADLVTSGGSEKAHDGGLSKNHSTDSVSSAGGTAKTHNATADLVSSGGVEKAHDVDLPKSHSAGKNFSLPEGTQNATGAARAAAAAAAVPPPAEKKDLLVVKDHGGDEGRGEGNLIKDGASKSNGSGSAGVKVGFSKKCDIFDGRWVRDERKPFYSAGSCPYIDTDFNCHKNGRPDNGFLKWRWQPNGCNIPRLNATDFLVRLRGKRLIFVGDSLNRNMWESLVCILRDSVKNKKRVYEVSGKKEFKTRGYYALRFEDYNCSVDFVRSPFLVRETYHKNANGSEEEKLRLDLLDETTAAYNEAEVVVFNTGHWWTHEKTSRGMDYYQEGNFVYPLLKVMEAYKKALNTWARWVDKNIDSSKTRVVFRGYSVTHFRGGQWNSGGQCHKETKPIFNDSFLAKYPSKMRALEEVLKGMKMPVVYLNISRLTDYRKDGHPSIYRKTYKTVQEHIAAEKSQDCSHWCLPGIPDAWNELLYASLLMDGQGPWRR